MRLWLSTRERYCAKILLTLVSQLEVGCPWARGLQPQSHPRAEEHPQAYQPATQPRQTAGQESAPLLTNHGKRYKHKQKSRTCATDGQHCTKERQKHKRPLVLVVNYIKYDQKPIRG